MSSSYVAPAATSSAVDAQTWVYPYPGAEGGFNGEKTSNIGPLYLYDKMVLQWYPTKTKPENIYLGCNAESGGFEGWSIAHELGQPFVFQFTQVASTPKNATDEVFCHLYFSPSKHGNTVRWRYISQQGPSSVTWALPDSDANTVSVTVTTGVSAPVTSLDAGSSAAQGTGHGQMHTSAISGSSSGGSRLSVGATAGIGVGVAIGILLVAAGAFTIFWRRRRRTADQQPATQPYQQHEISPVWPQQQQKSPYFGQPAYAPPQVPVMQEIGDGSQPIELSSSASRMKRQ